jgi:hypothetical protein
MIGFFKKLFGVGSAPAVEVAPYKVEVQTVTPVVQDVAPAQLQEVAVAVVEAVPAKKAVAPKKAAPKKQQYAKKPAAKKPKVPKVAK